MSEEITTKENPSIVTKEVEVDVVINNIRFKGIVCVTHDNVLGERKADFSKFAPELIEHLNETAIYCSSYVTSIKHILIATAYSVAGDVFDYGLRRCDESKWWGFEEDFTYLEREDEYVYSSLAYYFPNWNRYFRITDCEIHDVRDSDGDSYTKLAPREWWSNRYCCELCGCYLLDDEDYYGDGECIFCHERSCHDVIEGYTESHRHNDNPVLFQDASEHFDSSNFVGIGFELEVDCEDVRDDNNSVAEGLCSACDLEDNEMRYANDGSLNYGFECISQPHTVKDFWKKQDKWRLMLKYLLQHGYRSHDPNTCGLHVHVSRGMFGKTEKEQNDAIAKVYTFFDDNWDDLVKVSRRTNFNFCDKNKLQPSEYAYVQEGSTTKYKQWKKRCKLSGGHYVALNNSNRNTFEYRLGRGTLNTWSFFSWIDLVITITKNARRITVGKVESNDLVSWLGGISESTARYIYKRRAFRQTILALYPAIEWETDLVDSSSEHDNDEY